jgi:peptidoglycan/xylan/chitin deacetylase (PgdA/CDA1 family)
MDRVRSRPSSVVAACLTIVVVATLVLVAGWAGNRMGRAQAAEAGNYADTRVVYLTFDDGPDGSYTREVLADLQAEGAHATFFEVGENMAANCPLMRQLLADGNQLGTHSWDHPKFPALDAAQTAAEISRARLEQLSCTGHDSLLFRYPYDEPTAYGSAYLGSQLMLAVASGIDPSDWNWQHVSDAEVISRVIAQVRPGAVVQLHDGDAAAGRDHGHPGYLPGLLRELKAHGYAMVTLPGQGTPNSGHE